MAAMKRSGSMLLMFLLMGFPVLNAGCGGEVPQPTMEASEGEIICTVPEHRSYIVIHQSLWECGPDHCCDSGDKDTEDNK